MSLKGQFVITTIVIGFVGIVLLAGLLPAMSNVINTVTHNTTEGGGVDDLTGTLLALFPFLVVLFLIAGLAAYNQPRVVTTGG